MKISELKEKLIKIKVVAMDVDGTMTDGSLFYSDEGEQVKRFSARDGMGVTLLHKAGIETAIITSEISPIVQARAKKLRINNVILGSRNKSQAIEELAESLEVDISNLAFIGDDVNDYHALKCAGFSACPSDAAEQVKGIVDYVCSAPSGNGAVREVCEMILLSQNKSIILEENW